MLVRDRMSTTPITIMPDTPFMGAVRLMNKYRFRRLPVVDEEGRLIGIVSERDLLFALPAPTTSPSSLELDYLISKLKIRDLMTQPVVTIRADEPIEEAARLILENKIGGLPVVDEEQYVIGVITETDIFRTFVETFGHGEHGLRLSLEVRESDDVLAKLADLVNRVGGQLISVGSFKGEAPDTREYVVKIRDARLIDSIDAFGDYIVDVREV